MAKPNISVLVSVNWRDEQRTDFDRKEVRKVILGQAREVRKIARRMVSRKAISAPGEFPGKSSGQLQKSIKVFPGKDNSLFALVRPHKTEGMGVFYPEMLNVGTKRRLGKLAADTGKGKSNRRARGQRAQDLAARSASSDYIIKPRANYMEAALGQRRNAARAAISNAIEKSIYVKK